MPNLGDKLRQLEAEKFEADSRAAAAKQRAAEAVEQARRARVREFFDHCRRDAIKAISDGRIPDPVVTPAEIESNGSFVIASKDHPDFDLYNEFAEWAAGEGLEVIVESRDVGHRSAAKIYLKAASI